MMTSRYVLYICFLTLLLISSCGERKNSSAQVCTHLSIPSDSMEIIVPFGSVPVTDSRHDYQMVLYMYVDACMDCAMQQYPSYEDFAAKHNLSLTTVLEVSKENVRGLRYSVRSLHARQMIAIDTVGVFIQDNPIVKKYSTQVYLVDKGGEIVIEGNPLADDSALNDYNHLLKDEH